MASTSPISLRQPMYQADAADADAADPVGQFHANVRRCKHRLPLINRAGRPIAARCAAWLAADDSVYCVFTRNPPCFVRMELLNAPIISAKTRMVSSFLCNQPERFACLRTNLDVRGSRGEENTLGSSGFSAP